MNGTLEFKDKEKFCKQLDEVKVALEAVKDALSLVEVESTRARELKVTMFGLVTKKLRLLVTLGALVAPDSHAMVSELEKICKQRGLEIEL